MDDTSEFAAVAIAEDQLVAWPRIAAVAAMVAFSLPTFITGLELYHALTPTNALLALVLGSLIIFVIGVAMGVIGAKTHMSSYLLVRVAFGDTGAGIVNMAFMVSLIGWFGININLFADAAARLSVEVLGFELPGLAWATIASVCMTLTVFLGFKAINLFSSAMVPILAIVTALLFFGAFQDHSFAEIMSKPTNGEESLGFGISVIVGAIIVGAIILPDITRFARHWSGAVWTALIAYIVVQLAVMSAAVFAGGATGLDDILDIMLQLGLGVGAFLIVIGGSWALNALNLYSAVLSTKATFPQLPSALLTIGLGLVGIVAAMLNILDYFVTFLWCLSVIFVPVAGVVLIDYYLIKPEKYDIKSLSGNRAFNLKGFVAWAVGAVMAIAMEEGFLPSLTGMAAMDAAALSAIVYLVLAWNERSIPQRDQSL